jgi:hypothetical protein
MAVEGYAITNFAAGILRELHDLREVAIRTEKHPKSAVAIWVAVADDEVFVRSVRGTNGALVQRPRGGRAATLEFAGRRVAVEAIPASDPDAVARASREYLRKYQPSPYAQAMVKSEVLPTTLRLEPC